MTIKLGSILGNYRLTEIINHSPKTTIYKAFQPSAVRLVAAKVFTPGMTENLYDFRGEISTIAQLRHPNIVTVHHYGEEGDCAYVVTEYAAQSLAHRLEADSSVNWVISVKLMISVAEALEYAHQQGIIHGNLKPSNVLLIDMDWPLLTDFKLNEIELSTIPRTPYQAPEQRIGATVDHRADIYTLGILLLELLTGRLSPAQMAAVSPQQITARLQEFTPYSPAQLDSILKKALAPNPQERYDSAEAIASDLRSIIGTQTNRISGLKTFDLPPLPALNMPDIKLPPRVESNEAQFVKLVVLAQDAAIDVPDSGANGLILGRSYDNYPVDIDLTTYGAAAAGISRRHARLFRIAKVWRIQDLSSLNGTYINDKPLEINRSYPLKDGDIIRCGYMPLLFQLMEKK